MTPLYPFHHHLPGWDPLIPRNGFLNRFPYNCSTACVCFFFLKMRLYSKCIESNCINKNVFTFRKLRRPILLACLKTLTCVLSMLSVSPSCPRISNLPGESVVSVLKHSHAYCAHLRHNLLSYILPWTKWMCLVYVFSMSFLLNWLRSAGMCDWHKFFTVRYSWAAFTAR